VKNRLVGNGAIARDRPLNFRFDGKLYRGFAGDTLASALLGEGVSLVARSFKYHRPRGVFSAGPEEPNALVELRTGARREPNTRATVAEVYEGLEARSQNRWPSLRFDAAAVNNCFAPLLAAGFYYKTFMWPRSFWERLYEPALRRAAGLGRASEEADPDHYEKVNAFCDVLIVGAGPSGLSAALHAGRSGARFILCDEDFVLGGRLHGDRHAIDDAPALAWVEGVRQELASMPEVRLLTRTTVFGVYDGNFAALQRVSDHLAVPAPNQPRQRLWRIVGRHCILATGAIERPLIFGGNDRPGVMLAGAVRTYVNRFRVTPGRRVAVFTACDDGWRTALELSRAGIEVTGILDVRHETPSAVAEQAGRCGIPYWWDAQVIDTRGSRRLASLEARDSRGIFFRISADALAVSGGWNPNTALCTHLGHPVRWSDALCAFVPDELPRGMRVVGAAAGDFSLSGALAAGAAVGCETAQLSGYRPAAPQYWRCHDEAPGSNLLWVQAPARGRAFVDLQHDVTRDDIALAAREGFQSAELLKRYTTLGMGTDQGKTSALSGHAIIGALTQRPTAALGTIAARPPYTPVALGALAGRHRGRQFKPYRLTPSHRFAAEHGATFIETGEWLRAQWFAAADEDSSQAVVREVKTVRDAVGICDVSTLGKIDVQGADAMMFLDRVYANAMASLPAGKVRYGIMLREDGMVLDDGTLAHLYSGQYVLTTTTANDARVMQHLEFARQVLWPEADVQLTSVTEQWAQFAVSGPRARELLERLLGDSLDLSNSAFPYLACREFMWNGCSARLFRVSFTGELAYEVAVPAHRGEATIRALMAAGEPLGVRPYGTEALGVMRIEKGHAAGNELNGTTTAEDLGLGRLVSKKKDFIGRVLANRPGLRDASRPVLVGFTPEKTGARLYAGAHLLKLGDDASLENDQGFVSSVAYSPTLDTWIGLGFLKHGAMRVGECLRAYDPVRSGETQVRVMRPCFYDVEGERLRC
jgi:heterotetrameric sarcosine oxidase alpha subunit